MTLISKIKYEPVINGFNDISPEAVVSMLIDIRTDIGRLDSSFTDVDLARVIEVVDTGGYEVTNGITTRIDLSSAKCVIDAYKEYSEGGCQSCVNLGKETIDAQDGTSGWYCKVSDPDYDTNTISGTGVRYEGSSPKVKKHHDNPCDSWEPHFSPILEELIKN